MKVAGFEQISDNKSKRRRTGTRNADGIVYSSPSMMEDITDDESLTQAPDVASLPGILKASYGMHAVHW